MNSELDILSDVLDSLHICGSLLLHESYTAPWAITLPDAGELGQLLNVERGTRAVAFHLVERGHLELVSADASHEQSPLVVEAGEMVICFSGTAHQISQGVNPPRLPVENILLGEPIPFRCSTGTRGSLVCLCGVFYLHDTHLNPLFASLPSVLHAPISQAETFQNLSGVANLIVQELEQRAPGSNFMVERLLELLCAGAVRSYMARLQPQEPSWLKGVRDPIISRALALIHAQPGGDWSVDTLAQQVALSPSRFAARFKDTLGESPMSYVSKWRIHVASRLLNSTEKNISEIASEVGYENLAAFSRAFKRHLDIPPGMWRSQHCT
ncbi:RCS-specific HTH-type transcriptional activator RclR [Acaryochloris thomasi RCC1774]|uniref:RCS-specific HTH-type transcriptional activator RclR n=1 Tax=Acaryochloris thomasi RCC1774 TaxID=1764569 RepID=A0A2W1JMR1_9CYAN|nr:AraC family transcriptional regulator [Acaryochloris thomasi]PZD74640.1 RCS-specific HTH-type transcriptional activator RclR [Acaryochloris thomasi RCC1774]